MPAPGKGIRVISFDGPVLDATGFSELLILEDIAGKWAWDREDDDREGGDVRISELSDIVGGTGLGGFYAILFSLHMTVAQVITSHKILQDVVFSSEEWKQKDMIGSVAMLKTALARIIEEVGLEVDLDTPFLSKNSLKCFVCVLNDVATGRSRALRNYRVRSSKSPRCTVREAIHATLADGVHLPAVYIQDEQFICASLGFANPSYELMKELSAVFPKGSKLTCFANLGAGSTGLSRITSGGYCPELAKHVRDAQAVAENLVALCHDLGPCYFRLSVVTDGEGSTLKSAEDAIRIVKSFTMGYLEEAEIGSHLDALVDGLAQGHGLVSLERLGSLAAENGTAKLHAQVEAVHDHVVHIKNSMDNEIYSKIKTWLTPIDQTSKLDSCIRARNPKTCGWLWDTPRVVKWKETGGFFWCHAGMGAGKTIIMSHVVETLMKVPGECFVAFYYFEFTNPSTLSEEALFRSLVFQLSHANNAASRQLYEKHRDGSLQPQLTTLHEFLRELVTRAPLPVYIIIDALDEFPSPSRSYLLESLLAFSRPAVDGVHVMVTSRDELDIHKQFSGKMSLDFSIEREMVHHDIAVFVDQALAVEKWKSWPKQEVLNMRNTLIDKADGMFRMVACQIEVLNHAQSTEDMRRAVASLPATLSDTYLYILNSIPCDLRSRAHTLLCVLSVGLKPVSITELSALVTVDLGDPNNAINLPVYHDDLRYHEPQNIIGLGTALVRQTKDWYNGMVLQLAHASVKEYLLNETCSWCALNDRLANETTARACLALLIHCEDPRHTSGVVDMSYTKDYWWRHIHSNHTAQLLSQQVKLFEAFPWPRSYADQELFEILHRDRSSTDSLFSDDYESSDEEEDTSLMSTLAFAAWASLEQLLLKMLEPPFQWKTKELNDAFITACQKEFSTELLTTLIEKGGDVNATTKNSIPILHVAAHSGQLRIVQVLVEHGADVNSEGGEDGSALQAAASEGALDVVKFLVESGADVNREGGLYGSALQAAAYQTALDVVKFLVESGADVNSEGGRHGSVLQAAASRGALDIVKFLVESGADVNREGGQYGSALQAAASEGVLDVVKFLVESGADVNREGGLYGSVLQAAASRGALDVVKLLVESGADVNREGGWYGSALQAAAYQTALDVVKFLVENGADVNMVGGRIGSALHAAAYAGALDVVTFLVENGADVNLAGGKYGSALQAAAGVGALDVVAFFVETGADVNMVGGKYGSVLETADHNPFVPGRYSRRKKEVMTFLIAKGAVRSDGTIPIVEELRSEGL
ncbi:hypothetical protein DL96DRAFT_1510327 [Flagelloscypha sp. PMI_526]|nr:hypothetical protein DL96DRAFT_1510327 [Flagelloscypha sp. PMI_526]